MKHVLDPLASCLEGLLREESFRLDDSHRLQTKFETIQILSALRISWVDDSPKDADVWCGEDRVWQDERLENHIEEFLRDLSVVHFGWRNTKNERSGEDFDEMRGDYGVCIKNPVQLLRSGMDPPLTGFPFPRPPILSNLCSDPPPISQFCTWTIPDKGILKNDYNSHDPRNSSHSYEPTNDFHSYPPRNDCHSYELGKDSYEPENNSKADESEDSNSETYSKGNTHVGKKDSPTDRLEKGHVISHQYSQKDCQTTTTNSKYPNNHKQTINHKPKTFISALDCLQDRSDAGHPHARAISQQIKATRSEPKNVPQNKANPSVNFDDVQTTYKSLLGGEISEEILRSVLAMMLGSSSRPTTEGDIAGLRETKKIIRDKVINPILRPDLHFGLHEAPKGILLFGPPGTGKTMIARWIAHEGNATFFDVSPSTICSKWYGQTEALIRALFKVADFHSPAIIFIDEIDSLLGKRTEGEQEQVTRMKNQILQMMDGLGSSTSGMLVVVGATNRPDMLDQAALRRFSKRVLVPLPDQEARQYQIRHLLEKNSNGGCRLTEKELGEIADELENWNGSDIKSLCSRAADFSYDETVEEYGGIQNIPHRGVFRPLNRSDIFRALRFVHPSQDNSSVAALKEWAASYGSI